MKEKPVIILGLGPAGLFLVRQLSQITKNIYAVGRRDDVGMYSKLIKAQKRFYATNADELRTVFAAILDQEQQKPALYVCSDQYLSILLESNYSWHEMVELTGSDFETLELINNKNTINEFCMNHAVRIPASIPYSDYKMNRYYPIIVKWVKKRIETAVNPIGKIKVCYNESDFSAIDKAIIENHINEDELFVQDYIEGKNDCQFSDGGYYHNGIVLADVVVNQIMQHPQGISAEVITTNTPLSKKLQRITREFAKEVNYNGFLEIEYKVDAKTEKIYLLDINPRPWGWISILGTVYPDFFKVLEGKEPAANPRNAIWKSPMRILMGRKNKFNVVPPKGIQGTAIAYDIKDKNDLRPSFMIYIMAIRKIIRRISG